MIKIPDDLLPTIYDISKKVYEKKMSLTEGSEYLFNNHNLNAGSAKIYIIDFKHLMQGTEFKRTLNAYSMDFLLKNIKKDYGMSQMKLALPALQKHIHYYEETHKMTMHKLRAVYIKYLENK